MKEIFSAAAVIFMVFIFLSPAHADWDPKAKSNDEKAVKETIDRFMKADPGLQDFLDKAAGYAVLPTVGKGAYVVGVSYGRGWFVEGGRIVGRASISQLSAGAQIGGQAYSELLFFSNRERVRQFREGRFEVGAQIAAVIVKDGVAKATTYTDGVAIFILPKGGLMVDASISGQRFSFEPF
jgi:lipid-binding SYLF domain-containing protein